MAISTPNFRLSSSQRNDHSTRLWLLRWRFYLGHKDVCRVACVRVFCADYSPVRYLLAVSRVVVQRGGGARLGRLEPLPEPRLGARALLLQRRLAGPRRAHAALQLLQHTPHLIIITSGIGHRPVLPIESTAHSFIHSFIDEST